MEKWSHVSSTSWWKMMRTHYSIGKILSKVTNNQWYKNRQNLRQRKLVSNVLQLSLIVSLWLTIILTYHMTNMPHRGTSRELKHHQGITKMSTKHRDTHLQDTRFKHLNRHITTTYRKRLNLHKPTKHKCLSQYWTTIKSKHLSQWTTIPHHWLHSLNSISGSTTATISNCMIIVSTVWTLSIRLVAK